MKTDNHKYRIPPKRTTDWATPLNQNFETLEVDMPVTTSADAIEGNVAPYTDPDLPTPHAEAWAVATDTAGVYTADGTTWDRLGAIPKQYQHTASGDDTTTEFSLTHSLFTTPTAVHVTPTTPAAAGDFYVAARSAGDVTIEYLNPPDAGTDNLAWDLSVEA